MALSTNSNRVAAVGDGVTTTFYFNQLLYDETHLEVYLDSALQTTDYTVLGVPGASTYITFTTAPTAGVQVLMLRVIPLTQLSVYAVGGAFPAATTEKNFDLAVMGLQQFDEINDRSLRLPVAEAGTTAKTVLPATATRANKYLAFNSSGEVIAVDPATASGTSVLATGSTTARLLADRFAERFNVADYGAVGDGLTDDTTAIQAAIDAAGTAGGGTVYFPQGTFLISSTLTISVSNTLLLGVGHDMWHEDTSFSLSKASTILEWGGTGGGTMVQMYSPAGATLQKNVGGGVAHLAFDSGATIDGTGAGIGLEFLSWNSAELKHLYFHEFQTTGLRLGCITGSLDDPRDPQHNTIDDVTGSQYINVNGGLMWLDGDSATGGVPAPANVSLNLIQNCGGVFKDGEFFKLSDCDHNFFLNNRAFRHPSGTGSAIAFHGSDNGTAGQLTARRNTFIGFSGGVKILCYDATYTHPPSNNIFINLDDANNTGYPETEAGGVALPPLALVLLRTDMNAYYTNTASALSVYASTIANANDMMVDGRALMTSESHRFRNRSSNNIVLDRPNATNETVEGEWGINIRGASGSAGENLRINRVAGTGCIEMAAAVAGVTTVVTSSPTLSMLTAGISLVSASGGNRVVTLPLAAEFGAGFTARVLVRRTDASANTVTVNPNAAESLNGGAVGVGELVGAGLMRVYVSDGISAWYSNGLNA